MNYYSVYTIDSDPYVRLDKASTNCTKGKTIKCGNVCRQPQNCKSKTGGQYRSLLARKREEAKRSKQKSKLIKDLSGKKIKATETSKGIELQDGRGKVFTIPSKEIARIREETEKAIKDPSYRLSLDRTGKDIDKKQGWQMKIIDNRITIQDFGSDFFLGVSPKALKYALK